MHVLSGQHFNLEITVVIWLYLCHSVIATCVEQERRGVLAPPELLYIVSDIN